jgi:hypothetical protein
MMTRGSNFSRFRHRKRRYNRDKTGKPFYLVRKSVRSSGGDKESVSLQCPFKRTDQPECTIIGEALILLKGLVARSHSLLVFSLYTVHSYTFIHNIR